MSSDLLPRRAFLASGVATGAICVLGLSSTRADAFFFALLMRLLPAVGRFASTVAAGFLANVASDMFKDFDSAHAAIANEQLRRQYSEGFTRPNLPAAYRAPAHIFYPVGNAPGTDFRVPITFIDTVYPAPTYDEYGRAWQAEPYQTHRDLGFLRSYDMAALYFAANDLQAYISTEEIYRMLMPVSPISWCGNGIAFSSAIAYVTINNNLCDCSEPSVSIVAMRRDDGRTFRGRWPLAWAYGRFA